MPLLFKKFVSVDVYASKLQNTCDQTIISSYLRLKVEPKPNFYALTIAMTQGTLRAISTTKSQDLQI